MLLIYHWSHEEMKPELEEYSLYLISNLTHQAINPLNGVIGTLDNLVKGTVPENRRDQRLNSARSQLEYTVMLIRNLAYFAQYASDKTGVEPIKNPTDKTCIIPQVLIESAQFFQEQASNDGIGIEVEGRHIQNAVYGDPSLLRQVFMNIFDNAVKYGHKDSIVSVKNWIQKKTNDLIVTVEGESTPFENDDEIFAIGVRGKSAQEKTSSGSGLGLHICKLIVEKVFSGKISAHHSSAGIATFEIRIPGAFIKQG